jgi:DNA-binding NarL/FixJ family response regulator
MIKIDVIIVEDRTIFRKGLISTLKNFPEITVIGDTGNGIGLLSLLRHKQPDLILIDLKMSDDEGIETVEQVKSKYPDIKIIVLSLFKDKAFIMDMIQLGVSGFLSKNAEPEEMLQTMREVKTNGVYYDKTVTGFIIDNLQDKSRASNTTPRFSDKELRILSYICKEYKTEEIAAELNLSVRTIEGYRQKLLEKSGSKNVAGLVVYTMKNSLIDLL